MGNTPWLDNLSDDWVSTPGSPTSPVPSRSQNHSRRSSIQNTPSRIPIPARRLAEQQSPANGKKKVTRPCHFYKKEPPTPKTPRTPKTPSKLRSPVPDKTRKSPRPSLPSGRKQQPAMDSRSPLRSVSNVSSPSGEQDTVQVRPKKQKATTPEWRKRLVHGELPSGEQRDLFAPIGLESVFKPPTPGSDTKQKDAFAKMKPADDMWDFTKSSSARRHTRKPSKLSIETSGANSEDSLDQDSERSDGAATVQRDNQGPTGSSTPSSTGTLDIKKGPDNNAHDHNKSSHGASRNESQIRTASGLEDLRNEGITPIVFSRVNTVEGQATSEVIKSALKQVTNKLERLSVGARERPDSRASDSALLHQQSELLDSLPEEDLLDTTSHSLPQDLSTGTLDYQGRGAFANVRGEQYLNDALLPQRRFSPSSFLSQRLSPYLPSNSRIRSSPPFYNKISRATEPPTLPRPSSAYARPPSGEGNPIAMPSSGSPLKLFGNHDTFTNNRLLRRMSQFEETFGDLSEEDEPVSPSEEARRKGQSRNFLHVRQETPGDRSMRRQERPRSRNMMKPRISRFGDGELDHFDFSDTSPYEPKFLNNDVEESNFRPSSRRKPSGRRQHPRRSAFGNPSRDTEIHRPSSSRESRRPQPSVGQMDNPNDQENQWIRDTPAKDPNPKRRRTILSLDMTGGESCGAGEATGQPTDNLSLLQRSLIQHGLDHGNEESLLPQESTPRPRTPTPSQTRSSWRKRSSSNREGDPNARIGAGSPQEARIPMVKVTGVNEQIRKGSITTQDFLNEATKIMDIIRAKGKPAGGLSSVEESDSEGDGAETYEDESTREEFSRPPSREGVDIRKLREPKEPNPRILSHLKRFQEHDDPEFGVNSSVMSLHLEKGESKGGENVEHPKRKHPGNPNEERSTEVGPALTMDTHVSSKSLSSRSIPTASSFSSHAKGVLSSDIVSRLIPEQVNGFTYDRSKHQWVKEKHEQSQEKPKGDDSEEDPFKDIPDLSVDELQEMMRVHSLSSLDKTKSFPPSQRGGNLTSSVGTKISDAKSSSDSQPAIVQPPASGSTLRSKSTRFTSSAPNIDTGANPWGTDELKDAETSSEVEHEIQLHEGRLSKPPRHDRDIHHQARVVTISFSSPLVSHIVYNDGSQTGSVRDAANTIEQGAQTIAQGPHGRPRPSQLIADRGSLETQTLLQHLLSKTENKSEIVDNDPSILRRESGDIESTPDKDHPENSMMYLTQTGSDTTYSFHLSPLPDFTVDGIDQPLHLELSYVAQRTRSTSLRQIHGTFALATEDLVKHLTEAEPFEPYWDHVRRLVLRDKGLITLHKLSEFCPRLEDLDVSDNEIGQLGGVPASLRTLRIPRNCLSNLTAWGHLVNLQYLDVSNNELDSLDGFRSLIHLRELKADGNNIRNIDGILDLNGLLTLKLSNNSLATIDFATGEMTRLQELDLSHNRLVSVRHLDSLPSLSKLDLSFNQLKHIDVSSPLRMLRSLKLANNQLQTLDVSMFSSLNLLYIDQNFLSTVSGLERCRALEILSVRDQRSGNEKNTYLDIDLGKVKDIRKVYLSSNKLSTRALSPSAPLLGLQLLDAASCNLQSLPVDFSSNFPNLKVLNLNFNSLSGVTELVGLNCLSRLAIAGNSIVDLRGNPLTLRFYPPALTGNGKEVDQRRIRAIPEERKKRAAGGLDLASALADAGSHERDMRPTLWATTAETEREIDDPYTLPTADAQADQKYLSHLDDATRLRRKIFELMLYAGTGGSIKFLDGLEFRPVLTEGSDMDHAWSKLEQLGVLKKKAITQ
ncbi:hypothetical protein KXV98_009802 [Aspergillus fumigatus]|nr:hypothetical protein CNMCM8689_006885 [Aspergillus fumigatus]KAF4294646.1 hypothetical protein CNMCM8686_002704 [Aspergillus fumigatus]KAH1448270.1 hypothetical protein KXX68_001333 [Aspergillus fumigatus]KAH1466841.1 hypothetical protein KXX58_004698 [Aspergillus fumigatus]KAH1620989.1 hypothetical protein KXX31_007290 [Aspergillus fumigatus]